MRTDSRPRTARLRDYDAFLFDLDGVITRTATVHAAAWQRLFDEYLAEIAAGTDATVRRFDPVDDYRTYVDGRRRYDGVEAFLTARGLTLPHGSPDDPPSARTVCGLGNRKDRYFHDALRERGVQAYDDTVEVVTAVRGWGGRLAVVSASENCAAILDAAGLRDAFDALVTGIDAHRLDLAGKPAPDTFLEAARRVDVVPDRCVVFEDAIAGVQAGRRGGFGLVVGVDRRHDPARLEQAGADVVLDDLTLLLDASA